MGSWLVDGFYMQLAGFALVSMRGVFRWHAAERGVREGGGGVREGDAGPIGEVCWGGLQSMFWSKKYVF